ncbi:heme ABC exporter ATP-binding protein CcmA [Marilutibacter chinensis]|uniref:Heme ABC exporter ATP-binding protein CcmA n=1 Tax=Marilutibacter chinensis TaxID=2912247 RepID=A0ABS9HPX8_9GAMM|nr:heme ABC exporter ATP-binding protein CcmA [Lysobacter chinensis]MCF7220190.1 heme ABC exporter ATP-binding protein CcmA [Lysobacter chinensis]
MIRTDRTTVPADACPPPSVSTGPALLEVHGLRFSRNDVPVFGPLDFEVGAGEALLVQGDNGSGKTTLLRVLAGLLRADAGGVAIRGEPAGPLLRARALAYLGHLPGLKADLGVVENLRHLCGLHGQRRSQTIEGALAVVGLAGYEDTLARQLSAGQKKRLSLARLWLSPAPLWLMDEPYANLDLEGIELVNRMVRAHLDAGGASLVTTHGAYAAPPVRTRLLALGRPSHPNGGPSAPAAPASEPGT